MDDDRVARGSALSRRAWLRRATAAGAVLAVAGHWRPAAGQSKTIKIGTIEPLTGPVAPDGLLDQKAFQFAVNEVNEAGGIKSLGGARLELMAGDSQGKPELGMSEAERLIRNGAVVVLGAFQSSVTFTSSQVAEKHKVPYICPISSAGQIAGRGFKYLVKLSPDSERYAADELQFLKEAGQSRGRPVKSLALMYEDTLHGKDLAETFKRLAPGAGLTVAETIAYPHQTSSLTSEVGRVKASNADLLIAMCYVSDAILLTRAMAELKYTPIAYINNAGANNRQYIDTLGPLADGTLTNGEWSPHLKKAGVKEVNAKFKAFAGADMDGFRAENYTAIRVLLAGALERAASTDRDALMAALRATTTTDHVMPYEKISFDANGRNAGVSTLVLQIQKGTPLPVWPSKYAAADPLWPLPSWDKRRA